MDSNEKKASKARLGITHFFDSLINEIDLKAEQIIQSSNSSTEQRINLIRDAFLSQIKEVEESNLRNVDSLIASNKIDAFESKLFKKTCFVLDKNELPKASTKLSDIDLGILVITNGHMDYDEIDIFRNVMLFENNQPNVLASYLVNTARKEKVLSIL
jgi:hypothetical protein